MRNVSTVVRNFTNTTSCLLKYRRTYTVTKRSGRIVVNLQLKLVALVHFLHINNLTHSIARKRVAPNTTIA